MPLARIDQHDSLDALQLICRRKAHAPGLRLSTAHRMPRKKKGKTTNDGNVRGEEGHNNDKESW
jgi:hypothetical protein